MKNMQSQNMWRYNMHQQQHASRNPMSENVSSSGWVGSAGEV